MASGLIGRIVDLRLTFKFLLISLSLLALFAAALFGLLLPKLEDDLVASHKGTLAAVVGIAHSLLEEYEAQVKRGELSLAEAQKRALHRIRMLPLRPRGLRLDQRSVPAHPQDDHAPDRSGPGRQAPGRPQVRLRHGSPERPGRQARSHALRPGEPVRGHRLGQRVHRRRLHRLPVAQAHPGRRHPGHLPQTLLRQGVQALGLAPGQRHLHRRRGRPAEPVAPLGPGRAGRGARGRPRRHRPADQGFRGPAGGRPGGLFRPGGRRGPGCRRAARLLPGRAGHPQGVAHGHGGASARLHRRVRTKDPGGVRAGRAGPGADTPGRTGPPRRRVRQGRGHVPGGRQAGGNGLGHRLGPRRAWRAGSRSPTRAPRPRRRAWARRPRPWRR